MATPTAAQTLVQAESIAKALGTSQPELALPCLDLVSVFEVSPSIPSRIRSTRTANESLLPP